MAKKKATPETEETKKKKKNVVYKDINRQKGELSYKSIKELSAETGRTEASIRGEIQARGIDRMGDITIRRYRRIKELKKDGLTLRKICQDKELCELFNKPEGKTVSINTVRKYLHKDYQLFSHIDFSKVSTYSEYQRGKAADCLQSFGYSQDVLLKHILMLYVKKNHFDCDLTYSIGNFYKEIPAPEWKFDKFPQVNERGERPLPLDDVDEHVEEESLHSVVVDLPFIVKKLDEDQEDTAIITDRFDRFDTYEELVEANRSIIETASRLLRDEGFLIMKTQDSNSSGNQIWTHTLVEDIAEKNGLVVEDLFICINADENGDPRFLPIRKTYTQKHARKVHTYFYVFKKINQDKCDRDFKRAMKDLEKHNTDEAIERLTALARYGYRQAMLALGSIYYWGKCVDPDTYKAIHWLSKDADMGSRSACRNLGNIYYNMGSNPENDRLAWQYYSAAAMLDGEDSFYQGRFFSDKRTEFIGSQIEPPLEGEEDELCAEIEYFDDALDEGMALAGLYLWQIYRQMGNISLAETHYLRTNLEVAESLYSEGENLLVTPFDYNDWAYALCKFGEYEKALPYIEKCLSLAGKKNLRPSYLDTYAEILYGLGRLDEAKEAFNRCLEMYTEKDERRCIYEIKEKIRKKFTE